MTSAYRKAPAPPRPRLRTATLALAFIAPLVGFSADPYGEPVAASLSRSTATAHGVQGSMRIERVTLVTGDALVVSIPEKGPMTAEIDPVTDGGSPNSALWQFVENGDLYAIPPEAGKLVAEGRLDRELFNVAKLVEAGYTDATRVIVDYHRLDTARRGAAAPAPGTQRPALLTSISAVAATVPGGGEWWRQVRAARETNGPGIAATGPLAGVEKVWLDAPAKVSLAESVPQLGAPEAWSRGFDGTGVKVAVLDSGIDNEHPDVADQVVASRDFTDTLPSVDDDFGHGTHVAATVAGSGAASGGRHKGVAPGASLLDGKVCDNGGQCYDSWVIAGMEWATRTQGADVVNMSLAGWATDGTDPVSQAVDRLSAETGALIVVSAGNDGPGDSTVASPGAANAALTVGAVSKSEELANFSSRGPRVGDYAIKPDVTAPGVHITAARADGTSLCDGTCVQPGDGPVDANHTAASGTSMAAPHVAGAAAVLLHEHPDWTRQDVKGVLSSTGRLGDHSVWQQGGGRVDLARATRQAVYSPTGSLSFGIQSHPYPERVDKTVTYRNLTDADVTLDLALTVTDQQGQPARAGVMSLSASTLTVPAGGESSLTVSAHPATVDLGRYGGYLTASSGESRIHTAVGFFKQEPKHTVTVNVLGRDGQPASSAEVWALDAHGGRPFVLGQQVSEGVWRMDLPTSTWAVQLSVNGDVVDGRLEVTHLGDLEVKVEADRELSFDARDAVPVTARVPGHDVTFTSGQFGFQLTGPTGIPRLWGFSWARWGRSTRYFVGSMDRVTAGSFSLTTRFQLMDPEKGYAGPELFDLVYRHDGGITRADLQLVLDRHDVRRLAKVRRTFVANTEDVWFAESRFVLPTNENGPGGGGMHERFTVPGPVRRVDYLTVDNQQWTSQVRQHNGKATQPSAGVITAYAFDDGWDRYERGKDYSTTWFQAPLHPTFAVNGTGTQQSVRRASSLNLRFYSLSDSAPEHYGMFISDNELEVFQDGELVATKSGRENLTGLTGWQDIPVTPGDHTFRIELTTDTSAVARELAADFARRSPRTATTWTVRSPAPTGDAASVLPLMHVAYDLPLNHRNEIDRPGRRDLAFRVTHQDGADGGRIAGLRLWTSTDDGRTWTRAPVTAGRGGAFTSPLLVRPGTEREVSLKVEAWDTEGNRITQRITRAFGIDTTR